MWIRSQDGKSLTDCNSFAVERFFEQYEVVTFNRSGISVALGIYSSEEKALKILSEIQNIIKDTQYYVIYNKCLGNYVLNKGIQVYQMPQDEKDF